MTLILWIATRDYLLLASDRRVSRLHGDRVEPFEDSQMKTFVLDGQALMGFTGLVNLGGQPIEEWLVPILKGTPLRDKPGLIREALNSEFGKPSTPLVGHAFAVVGYEMLDGRRTPHVIRISNYHDDDGRLKAPSRNITLTQTNLKPRGWNLGAVGWGEDQVSRILGPTLRQIVKRSPTNPESAYNAVVGTMRLIAEQSGGLVGSTVLLSSVPARVLPTLAWALPSGSNPLKAEERAYAILYAGEHRGKGSRHFFVPSQYFGEDHAIQITMKPADEA